MSTVPTKTDRARETTIHVVDLMRTDPARAAALGRKAVKKYPRHAPLWHATGLSTARDGQLQDAVQALYRASQLEPDDAGILTDLCNALRRTGATNDAIAVGRRAVELEPNLAAAHNNYGSALRQAGRLEEAERQLRVAIDLAPDVADIRNNLGNVFKTAMRYEEAVEQYLEALALRQDYAEAMTNLGATYVEMGRLDDAEETCRSALEIHPALSEAHRNLGAALYWKGDLTSSLDELAKANELSPRDPTTRKQLALAFIESDQFSDATNLLVQGLRQDRPAPGIRADEAQLNRITLTKLNHDAQQYRLLMESGALEAPASLLADIDSTLQRHHGRGELVDLREVGVGTAPSYVNRVLHIEPAGPVPGGALNPTLDYEAIATAFQTDELGVVTIDEMLKPEALKALRRFCERSTIWFQSNFAGELGTSMVNGFAAPLIFQIARNLKEAFPSIFGPHMFQACWAYRYYADQSGLDLHTDAATVSMNLWVTPDEANLDATSGGLVFWNKRGPKDFFAKSMEEKSAILDDIAAEPGAETQSVPYRCNRALLFGAGILHRTDAFSFKNGYHDRRMNVTFLFGQPA